MNQIHPHTEKIVWIVAFGAILYVLLGFNPLPQNTAYHLFAGDCNAHFIPNLGNVVSNLGFLIFGVWGILKLYKDKKTKVLHLILLLGMILTSFGSAYYHWHPNNETLFWDRLPMTIVFGVFFAFAYSLYFGEKKGNLLAIVCIILGIFSVVYWKITEQNAEGDLRPYLLIQFLPILLILIFVFMNLKSNVLIHKSLMFIFGYYLIAKICEHYDRQIFHFLAETISGHSIKHIFASLACFEIVKSIRK